MTRCGRTEIEEPLFAFVFNDINFSSQQEAIKYIYSIFYPGVFNRMFHSLVTRDTEIIHSLVELRENVLETKGFSPYTEETEISASIEGTDQHNTSPEDKMKCYIRNIVDQIGKNSIEPALSVFVFGNLTFKSRRKADGYLRKIGISIKDHRDRLLNMRENVVTQSGYNLYDRPETILSRLTTWLNHKVNSLHTPQPAQTIPAE